MVKLRDEVNGWILSQNSVMRTLIVGVSAVVVLGEDVDVAKYLPLAPILAVLLLTQFLSSVRMVFRVGWSMAVHEARINSLAEDQLLTHEIRLWSVRKKFFCGRQAKALLPAAVLLGSAIHLGLVAWSLRSSELRDSSEIVLIIWVAALVVTGFAIGSCIQIRQLFMKLDDPEVVAAH